MPRGVAAAAANASRNKRKKRQLKDNHVALQKQQDAALDQWMAQFDVNHDQTLEKAELAKLLTVYQPDVTPPDDQMLDYLMEVSAKIDGDRLTVKRESLFMVMQVYRDYAKDKETIDAIFDKFDADSSGFLERGELLKLLRSYHEEHPELYPEPEEVDAEFILDTVLKQNDTNDSQEKSIAKIDILPAIATWRALAQSKMEEQECADRWGCCLPSTKRRESNKVEAVL